MTIKNKKKRLLVFFTALILISLGLFLAIKFTTQTKISSENISDRSKEYLKDKKFSHDANWSGVNIDKKSDQALENTGLVKIGDCFSINIPFPAKEIRNEGKCFDTILLSSPKGQVVVYQKQVEGTSLEDLSDIKLRKIKKEIYEESTKQINGLNFLIYNNKEKNYEKSAFYLKDNNLIVINLIVSTNENLDPKFEDMLNTIKITN